MILSVIDSVDEAILRRYHGGTEYTPADGEPDAEGLISVAEVEEEIHEALILSVMVGAPA